MEAVAALAGRRRARRRARALVDAARHRREDLGRHVVAAECLGERDDAEPQRFPRLDAAARRSSRRRRVSQTISEEPPPISNSTVDSAVASASSPQPAAARRASVSRSTISSCSPSRSRTCARNSAPFSAARHASVAIRRARVTPRAAHLVAADLQRLDRALDRRLAQPAGLRKPLAEPDDARERVDDPKSVGGRPRDQQPAIVGAQIQRGIRAAAARPRPAPTGRAASATRGACARSGLNGED